MQATDITVKMEDHHRIETFKTKMARPGQARHQTNLSHSHIYCKNYPPRQPQLPEQRQYWKLSLSEHAVHTGPQGHSTHYNTIIMDLLSQPPDHYYTTPTTNLDGHILFVLLISEYYIIHVILDNNLLMNILGYLYVIQYTYTLY